MKIEVLERKQGGSGDVAWVITRSRFTGTYKGKPIDSHSTETLVLQRAAQDCGPDVKCVALEQGGPGFCDVEEMHVGD